MPQVSTPCPTAERLSDFARGKLSSADVDAVALHLKGCAACRQALEKVSDDSFLGEVRAAQPSAGPLGKRAAEAVSPQVPPDLLKQDKYRIDRVFGQGGMGMVIKATHVKMDRVVALKVMNAEVLKHPEALERFEKEVRAAAKLDHPNIVKAYDSEQMGSVHLLVMEFVDGWNLHEVVDRKGPLSAAEACHFVRQAAMGLQHAHEKGMIHRDIKPNNLMVTRKGLAKVLDFGLASMAEQKGNGPRMTQIGSFMGTVEYMAPEQALDATKADIRSDIYSLGGTLYFLLTGRPPFVGTDGEIIKALFNSEPRPVRELRPDVPEGLHLVVEKMLAKEPGQRYQTPAEVARALQPFSNAEALAPAPKRRRQGGLAAGDKGTKIAGDTAPNPPAKAPAPSDKRTVIAESQASPFDDLDAGPAVAAQPRRRKQPANGKKPAGGKAKWFVGVGVGLGALLLAAVVGLLVPGIFSVKTPDGVLVVEVNEPNPDVFVDGEKVTVTWDGGGKKAEISIKRGSHKVELKKDGFTVYGEEVEIKDEKRKVLSARLVSAAPPPPAPGGAPAATPQKDDWVPLFNGKDLTGWEARQWGPANRVEPWQVKDGVLVVNWDVSGAWGALLTQRSDYQNFRFRVEMNAIEGAGWAGSLLYLWQEKEWYRCQIGTATGRDVAETGVIQMGKLRVTPSLPLRFRGNEWFTQEVVVEGKRIRVFVNNVQVNEHMLGELPQPGRLGITLSGVSRASIRRIEVQELPSYPPDNPPEESVASDKVPGNDSGPAAGSRKALQSGKGKWTVDGTELVSDPTGEGWILFGDPAWEDYDFSFTLKKTGGNNGISALFRGTNTGNIYLYNLGVFGNTYTSIELTQSGKWGRPSDGSGRTLPFHKKNAGYLQAGGTYRIRVEVRGTVVRCFLDDAKVFDYPKVEFAKGLVGLRGHGNTQLRVSDIKVTAAGGKVLWEGLPELSK